LKEVWVRDRKLEIAKNRKGDLQCIIPGLYQRITHVSVQRIEECFFRELRWGEIRLL
jgi:hypothetical protein